MTTLSNVLGNGIGADSISLTISTSNPLGFSGGANITGTGPEDGPSATVYANADMSFGGSVTVDGEVIPEPQGARPGGMGILSVQSGATVTAAGGFLVKQGFIDLGRSGSGTLDGNVNLISGGPNSGVGAHFQVWDDFSKVDGNVTLGQIGGGAAACSCMVWIVWQGQ